jgi:hypothetical protein
MGLGNENSFNEFLSNLQMDKNIYLLALWSTLQKPTLFLKCKPCDIHTNSFNIHVRPSWEANTYVQYILDPYAIISYYTSYLIKVDKFMMKEMQ